MNNTSSISPIRGSVLGRYGAAVVVAAILVAARGAMAEAIPVPEAPFLFAMVGIALAAWFGGWGPGTLTTVITAGLTSVVLVDPAIGGFGSLDAPRSIRITAFLAQGTFISILIGSLARARNESLLRTKHQILLMSVAKAIFGAGSAADAADAILNAFASHFSSSAALLWRIGGKGSAPECIAASVATGSEHRGAVSAFEEMRRAEQPSESDIVCRAAHTARALFDVDDRWGPQARAVIALPIALGADTGMGRTIVLELRRRRRFGASDASIASMRDLGAEIGQCMRGRAAEWTVAELHEALSQRAQELQAILDTAPIGIAVALDEQCKKIAVNDAGTAMLGLVPAAANADDRDFPVSTAMRTALTAAKAVGPVEVELVQPDGIRRSIFEYAAPLLDSQQRVRGCVGAFVEITSLREAERALLDKERAYRMSFERAGVGKAHIDLATGRFELVNRRLCEMLGYSAEEIVGRAVCDVVEPSQATLVDAMLHSLKSGREIEHACEYRYLRRDGAPMFGATSATVGEGINGIPTHVFAVIQDVTERRRAEEELERYRSSLEELVAARTTALEASHRQLRLSERMAALGTLSAGLGHDMGNLLLPVRLRLESMVLKGVPANLEEDVQAIAKCAEYLQRLANGLRLLSLDPEQPSTQETTELLEWWTDIEAFLKNSLPRGVELERRIESGLPAIAVSRHRLTQALFNLIQNAGDAVRERPGGWVRVSASRGPNPATVRIAVADNGIGMRPEIRARCLEPFFTSKKRGISTGLGLSLVHGIVQQSSGSIDVESDVERGTTFTLTFPVAALTSQSSATTPFGPPVKALVSFARERLSNYAVSVARAIGADVEQTTKSAIAQLDLAGETRPLLWIADAADIDEELMQAFLQRTPNSPRRILVFGGTPDGRSLAPAVEWFEEPTPSRIRSVLRKTIAAMVEESDLESDGVRAQDLSAPTATRPER